MCERCGKGVSDEKMQELVTFIIEESGREAEAYKTRKKAMAESFMAKAEELDLPPTATEYAALAAAVKMGRMTPGEALMRGLTIVGGKFDITNI